MVFTASFCADVQKLSFLQYDNPPNLPIPLNPLFAVCVLVEFPISNKVLTAFSFPIPQPLSFMFISCLSESTIISIRQSSDPIKPCLIALSNESTAF